MSILYLDHFSLRTEDVEQTTKFFVDAIGLENGPRPPFKFPGTWLYVDGKPVIHVLGIDEETNKYLGAYEINGNSAADHVAFQCQDPDSFRQRFNQLGLEYFEREVPETNVIQIFLKEPNGFTVELQFAL